MKQFICAKPPESSVNTIAYGGYINRVNIDKIIFIYHSASYDKEIYNIVLDFGNRVETWQVSEKTFNEL